MTPQFGTPKATAAAAYAEAGVDLERGYEVVRRIKDDVAATRRPGVMAGIGGFGGLFDLSSLKYREPVLVSGTDGVGTKLFLAFQTGIHTTVGIDAVAMCVNDVIVQGAEPLFFLDYIAIPKADPQIVSSIVHGIAGACSESGCALIGGETAEMNDLYEPGSYDIAGFCVAAAEKSELITGSDLRAGDVLLGLASSGPHSNGYSLLRKVFFEDHSYTIDSKLNDLDRPLGVELLEPTRLYVQPILALLDSGIRTHGMANITGGGFYENIPRMNHAYGYSIELGSWPRMPIFDVIARESNLGTEELHNVFNMGIGFVLALDPADVDGAQQSLASQGVDSYVIGRVTEGSGVTLTNASQPAASPHTTEKTTDATDSTGSTR
ncbi:MAG: phosphoribosylformylglycinamidine cyclo-ligase [Actinomycetaceae bacterium]|nr:phosphoribosylformylglycinamidine cyclo-ligase [Arcanobacterium sp.]MDD7504330.1 phosphoribosylformylglycinamidine cyclo-ligase [Actinomycetaceae bacterium]MDY6143921.1 phosphoribosylformylglycinamidine cyclo-ligase [Arcanobacterium sp.]